MAQAARVGDSGAGTCHHPSHSSPIAVTGVIIEGSPSTEVEGAALARLGDSVQTSCGHMAVITSCSARHTVDGKGIARVGDSIGDGDWEGTITSGASKCDVM